MDKELILELALVVQEPLIPELPTKPCWYFFSENNFIQSKNLPLKLSLGSLKLSSLKPCPCHIQPYQPLAFYANTFVIPYSPNGPASKCNSFDLGRGGTHFLGLHRDDNRNRRHPSSGQHVLQTGLLILRLLVQLSHIYPGLLLAVKKHIHVMANQASRHSLIWPKLTIWGWLLTFDSTSLN